MAKGVLRVRIVGDERELTSSLKRAHTEVGKFSGGVSGALKGLALLGGGAALVGGFKKAIDQTVQWGLEVKTLTRNLGISSQQASGLALAAEHYGLGVDQLSKGLGIFEKHIVAGDKAAQSLGITFKNNKGQLLPFNAILEKTSAVFQKLPDGPQKTALALNLFGRSGKDLIPFLNAGPKAMQQFSEEAKKLGLSLSGENLRTILNYKFATRDFTASLHGLEVQVGLRVLPVMTEFVHIAGVGVQLLGKIPTPVLGAAAAFGAFVLAVSLASKFTSAAKAAIESMQGGLSSLVGSSQAAATAVGSEGTAAEAAATANVGLGESSLGLSIAALKEATAMDLAAAAAERLALANSTAGEQALGASIALQREAAAATEVGVSSTAASGGFKAVASAGLSLIGRTAPLIGAVVLLSRAFDDGSGAAQKWSDAFITAAQATANPAAAITAQIQKLKTELAGMSLEEKLKIHDTSPGLFGTGLGAHVTQVGKFIEGQIKDLQTKLKELGDTADAAAEAGATGLSKIEGSLRGTSAFQSNLKTLVAEGVPLEIANQLKTMGQDGIDAAQQLVDGTQEARDAFVALAEAAGGTALGGMRDTFTATIHLNSALKTLVSEGVPQQVADQLKTIPGAADELLAATPEVRAEFVKMALAAADTGTAVDKLVGHFNDLKTASDHFKSALDATLGATLNVQDATARYDQDLAALGTSLKANGRSFDLNTQKGRDNSQALRTLVGDIQDQIAAEVASGKVSGTDAAQKAVLLQRLHDLERKFPALKTQIETYIGAVKRIPSEHPTTIKLKVPTKADIHKLSPALQRLINAEIQTTVKPGVSPVISPKFTTPSMTVTAAAVYLSSGTHSAEGRIVTSPMFSLIGEAGPEAVIPLSFGKKARRDQLLRESGLMHEILASYGVKLGDGALVSGRSGGSIPASLYSVASVRAPGPSSTSVTYDDHSTVIVNNPIPERLSETLPALRRRKQLLRGH